jgi:ATP-dependent DNA helicase RecQ
MKMDLLQPNFALVAEKYHLGIDTLKPQQEEAIGNLLEGRNTFCIFPTGFGKSLVFTLLPLLWDEVSTL